MNGRTIGSVHSTDIFFKFTRESIYEIIKNLLAHNNRNDYR